MTDPLSLEAERAKTTRLDIVVFFIALVIGVGSYFLLRALGIDQRIITAGLVAVMVFYAATVALVPRLRVRLDQAGDNAYYLGLLFTLVSMAVALSEFGSATYEAAGAAHPSGAKGIVEN